MKGNFGLYVVPHGEQTTVLKIDYNTGKTWAYDLKRNAWYPTD